MYTTVEAQQASTVDVQFYDMLWIHWQLRDLSMSTVATRDTRRIRAVFTHDLLISAPDASINKPLGKTNHMH